MSATPQAEASEVESGPGAGSGLLWVLALVAIGFALARPRAPVELLKLVDWQTVGALAGLLAIMQGVERSGVLQSAAARMLSRATDLRSLTLLLAASAAVLSALVTNDVSLFLLVPLTRVLAAQAHLPLRASWSSRRWPSTRVGAHADRQSAEPLSLASARAKASRAS